MEAMKGPTKPLAKVGMKALQTVAKQQETATNHENRIPVSMLVHVVENPWPVAMYLASPNVKALRMKCVKICFENISKNKPNCFARRNIAFHVPESNKS